MSYLQISETDGVELKMTASDELPTLMGKIIKEGSVKLPPHSIMFLTY